MHLNGNVEQGARLHDVLAIVGGGPALLGADAPFDEEHQHDGFCCVLFKHLKGLQAPGTHIQAVRGADTEEVDSQYHQVLILVLTPPLVPGDATPQGIGQLLQDHLTDPPCFSGMALVEMYFLLRSWYLGWAIFSSTLELGSSSWMSLPLADECKDSGHQFLLLLALITVASLCGQWVLCQLLGLLGLRFGGGGSEGFPHLLGDYETWRSSPSGGRTGWRCFRISDLGQADAAVDFIPWQDS